MDLHLMPEEAEFIDEVMSAYLSDLRMEIAQTDNPEYRRGLRHKEDLAHVILARLEVPIRV